MSARRGFLRALAGAGALGAGLQSRIAIAQAAQAPVQPVRITLPSPGSAGSAWQPIVDRLKLNTDPSLVLNWVVADPGKMQTQLSAGALDIGVFGPAGLATLASRGSDITLFGPALNNHGCWLVPAGSPYRTPKDLLGKTIAATAETSEIYQQARIAASLSGIDLKKDVKVIFGAPTANLALFERGDVDALITLEPTASRLVARGARQIARVADVWKQATGLADDPILVGLAANRAWLESHRETAQKVVALFKRVNGAIRQQPQLLTTVSSEMGLKADEAAANALLPTRMASIYATEWDARVFATIDRQIEVAAKLGIIDKPPAGKLYRQL